MFSVHGVNMDFCTHQYFVLFSFPFFFFVFVLLSAKYQDNPLSETFIYLVNDLTTMITVIGSVNLNKKGVIKSAKIKDIINGASFKSNWRCKRILSFLTRIFGQNE